MQRVEMDDYSALAQRVAVSVGDVRGCLILSRDGLVLGAYPEDDEMQAKPAWLRFGALGDAERSFVEFGDQVWVFCHRGAYSSFAVAGTSIRPGLLLDMMEQALLAAEEARTKREPLKLPDLNAAPSGKPRTTMHRSTVDEDAEMKAGAQRNWSGGRGPSSPGGSGTTWADDAPAPDSETPSPSEPKPEPTVKPEPKAGPKAPDPALVDHPLTGLTKEPQKLAGSGGLGMEDDDGGEVDRVMLAKEFSGLLQIDGEGDE